MKSIRRWNRLSGSGRHLIGRVVAHAHRTGSRRRVRVPTVTLALRAPALMPARTVEVLRGVHHERSAAIVA
ncbi:MAG: hypothetical protein ACREIA_20525 [Opitutaceae bacterium]